ncbi:hypothetical protein ACIQUF_10480 [Pseudomonas sp. NPDC090233]|uniref:hypothetical protein n=1 Tax=Pseudomonas sp. NPDC090233 TaxID=3364479 RepID=UPI00383A3862
MSNNKGILGFEKGKTLATVTWHSGSFPLKITRIWVSTQYESISLQGMTGCDGDSGFIVDIWFPKAGIGEKEHTMGCGETAPAGGYMGSFVIPRSGYATKGKISGAIWNPETGSYEASFEFTVETEDGDEVTVTEGFVSIDDLRPYLK